MICPRCGKLITEHPALSRRDNSTFICPACGIDEAIEDYLNNKHLLEDEDEPK